MDLKCLFDEYKYRREQFYRCLVKDQEIPENCVDLKFNRQHQRTRTDKDVTCLHFSSCIVTKVPQGITKIFPNLKILTIFNSKLKKITKNDLIEFKNLQHFWCRKNEIEFLPRGLFEGFENLESLTFHQNNLHVISPNIIDGLEKLKLVNFGGNKNYLQFYSTYPGNNSNSSLEDMKAELLANFECFSDSYAEYLQQKNPQFTYNLQKGIANDFKVFINKSKSYSDFTIIIDHYEFPVHKFLLAARSPTLAEILNNNPEASNLNLVDISVEIFEIIRKFLYTDELPGDDRTNFIHLHAAAAKLQIKELQNYAAVKIIEQIDENNALDILKLSNKYDHDEMRFRAFADLKKKYPNYNLKFKFADDLDKINKFTEAIKRKEEVEKDIEEIFKNQS